MQKKPGEMSKAQKMSQIYTLLFTLMCLNAPQPHFNNPFPSLIVKNRANGERVTANVTFVIGEM